MTRLRRALWVVGAPARASLIGGIRLYRATLSGWLGGQCRFYPSCSHYAEDAIRLRGAVRGSLLAAWRILRCNPFGKGGVEHVAAPPTVAGVEYDVVLPADTAPPPAGAAV
jgi:putative membrane protein insertion efficiency factor